jgi:hypothetical protein
MSTGWRLIFGLGLIAVGVVWIFKREIPIGIEGRPPSFHARALWAISLGILAIVLGLVVAFDLPHRLRVDSCLDRGGSFNYDENACDSSRNVSGAQ